MFPRTLRAALLTTLTIGITTGTAGAALFTEELRETRSLAPGGEIALSNTNGSVTVRSWERETVELVAEKRIDSRSAERAQEAFERIEIVIRETAAGLEIETRSPSSVSGFLDWLTGTARNASVRYELRVPVDARLRLTTVNGNLRTEGAGGDQRLRSTNGRIAVAGAASGVDARTVNGSIDVEVTAAGTDLDLRLGSTNGGIVLAVPRDLEARLDVRTVNGSVRTDLPVAVRGSANRRRIAGELNGGGNGWIEVSTTNGGIRIQAADS